MVTSAPTAGEVCLRDGQREQTDSRRTEAGQRTEGADRQQTYRGRSKDRGSRQTADVQRQVKGQREQTDSRRTEAGQRKVLIHL